MTVLLIDAYGCLNMSTFGQVYRQGVSVHRPGVLIQVSEVVFTRQHTVTFGRFPIYSSSRCPHVDVPFSRLALVTGYLFLCVRVLLSVLLGFRMFHGGAGRISHIFHVTVHAPEMWSPTYLAADDE